VRKEILFGCCAVNKDKSTTIAEAFVTGRFLVLRGIGRKHEIKGETYILLAHLYTQDEAVF
jgi:hypothetical protein